MAPSGPDPGLCGTCANVRRVVSGRGSVFYLCTLSAVDPRYPRYPRLPVLACAGWRAAGRDVRRSEATEASHDDGESDDVASGSGDDSEVGFRSPRRSPSASG